MVERGRAWAHFARLLLPEMQLERRLLEWIRDEDIDRVVAYLESWTDSEQRELDDYRARLDSHARFFRRDGSFTHAGWERYHSASAHEQERLDEIKDRFRDGLARIHYVRRLIRYASERAAGTLDIRDADQMYADLESSRPGS